MLNALGKPFKVDKLVGTPVVDNSAGLASITQSTDLSPYFADASAIGLTTPFNNAAPGLIPMAGSPALNTAGKFDKGLLSDPFFTQTSYVGALDASNDWSTGWAVWGK